MLVAIIQSRWDLEYTLTLSYYFLTASFSLSLSPAINSSPELPSKFSSLQSLSLFLLFFLFSLSISYIYIPPSQISWIVKFVRGRTSVQFNSATQSCPNLCDPTDCRTPGFPVHHELLELAQTNAHRVSDPSNHPILCCPLLLPPIFRSIRVFSNKLVLCIRHQVATVLEFQLQHQSFQTKFRTD